MTTTSNEDPAPPGATEGEAWYDAEIAPALAALAKRCRERGMSLVAAAEYKPDHIGATYFLTEDAGTAMRMLHLCGQTAPNVDSYVVALKRWAALNGVDTSSSWVLSRW
jgi:hypothetical protein